MHPPHRLPSLNALRAFEAVARRLSFRACGGGAVRHQGGGRAADPPARGGDRRAAGAAVRARLAAHRGGAAGAAGLTDGFGLLLRSARARRETKGRRFLVINASASFAATWLVRRIGRFKARHPDIDVLVDADPREDTLERGDADAMIRWGDGAFAGLSTTKLFREEVFPVCAPQLVEAEPPLRAPGDLGHRTLLHLEWNPSFPTWPSWSDWLKAAGVGEVEATRGVFFNQMSLAIGAAAQGQGVALSSFAIAADDLASGRLVAPFATTLRTPYGYYFLCRPDAADTPRIRALRDFLVDEAALSSG